jgi:type II secretory pathway component GspD/PulD (secretin)
MKTNCVLICLALPALICAKRTALAAPADTKPRGSITAKPPILLPANGRNKPTVPVPVQIESIRAYLEDGATWVDIRTRGVASPLLSGSDKTWTISFPGATPSSALAANMTSGGLVRQVGMETAPDGSNGLGVKLALSASGVGSLVPSARRDLVRVRLAATLPAASAAEQVKSTNGLYDVNAFQSDFATILASLSKDAGSNVVVVSPPVGKITLNLKQVTFEQAVQMLAHAAGMVSRKENDTLYLGTAKDLTAAFPPPVEETPKPVPVELKQEVYVCRYIVAADLVKSLTAIFDKDNLKVALGANTFSPRLDEASTAAVTGVESAAKTTMSTDNAQNAHSVMLYGSPDLVAKAIEFAKKMDIRRKQVRINVRITDINNDALRELGVQWEWSKYRASEAGNFTPLNGGGAAGGGAGATQTPQVSGINFGAFIHDATYIQATLSSLERSDRAKLLAAPSLSLLDGERGFILIGDRLVFPVLVGYTQAGSPIFNKTEERVGIYLQVAAQIADNGEVTLSIYPQVSVVTNFLIVNGASYPQISTREQQTTIRVKDNEQIVVGGLIREEEVRNVQRVPFLSRIPLFGELFTYRKSNKRKSEVVIVITPEILKD